SMSISLFAVPALQPRCGQPGSKVASLSNTYLAPGQWSNYGSNCFGFQAIGEYSVTEAGPGSAATCQKRVGCCSGGADLESRTVRTKCGGSIRGTGLLTTSPQSPAV